MISMNKKQHPSKSSYQYQQGAVQVEYALAFAVFVLVLIVGIKELTKAVERRGTESKRVVSGSDGTNNFTMIPCPKAVTPRPKGLPLYECY